MAEERLKYPIGQQDFKDIRKEGKIYVDKTALIYELVRDSKYKFLSRPRRFGKSLLLSTIKYYFQGEKELFRSLAIYDLEKEWKKHPVLHLQLTSSNASDHESLKQIIREQFENWEKEFEISHDLDDLSARFSRIIRRAQEKTGERVVILIDEYDNALVNTLQNKEIHNRNRELLKSIYSNLKDMDEYIKFGILTGVSRFSRAGIFSGLNNLDDITFDSRYATICGFTEDEIRKYLWPGVENIATSYETNPQGALNLLKSEYDGYHFSKDLIDVYNPFSLLNALSKGEILNYWIQSGTPEFLIKRIESSGKNYFNLFNEEVTSATLDSTDTQLTSPVALLYQTGYLTIKGTDLKYGKKVFRLGVPNKEVREGFFSVLMTHINRKEDLENQRDAYLMRECLEKGEVEGFMERLKSFMAGIPYHLTSKAPEIYFENNLFVIFQLMGLDVRAEDKTSYGRIDLRIKTDKYIYILEIKVNDTAEAALKQIENKEYALKYKFDGRKIICIGATFSTETRNISQFLIHKA